MRVNVLRTRYKRRQIRQRGDMRSTAACNIRSSWAKFGDLAVD